MINRRFVHIFRRFAGGVNRQSFQAKLLGRVFRARRSRWRLPGRAFRPKLTGGALRAVLPGLDVPGGGSRAGRSGRSLQAGRSAGSQIRSPLPPIYWTAPRSIERASFFCLSDAPPFGLSSFLLKSDSHEEGLLHEASRIRRVKNYFFFYYSIRRK